ncbi:3600_t:CDS:1, partial [Paraglomus brasilianum]
GYISTLHNNGIPFNENQTPIKSDEGYNTGSRIKIEGAIIYCELQHSTFVIPKNNTTTNDTSSPVFPSSSRRAATVQSIAEHSPPTKKPKLSLLSTIASESAQCRMKTCRIIFNLNLLIQAKEPRQIRLNPDEQLYEIYPLGS